LLTSNNDPSLGQGTLNLVEELVFRKNEDLTLEGLAFQLKFE